MEYIQVSKSVLCDLLNSKSKVTDMKLFVEENAIQLKEMQLLNEMAEILYSERYSVDEKGVTENDA